MPKQHANMIHIVAIVAFSLTGFSVGAVEVPASAFDRGLATIQQEYAVLALLDDAQAATTEESVSSLSEDQKARASRKSPTKAFALSLLVPGLGQYYYGSRIKPFLFLGTDVAAWTLNAVWHRDGENMTDEFEDYADLYWAETRYTDYLIVAYGESDDQNINETEISHSLPDDKTQQYYEMIGKYNQFAWGWDDAYRVDAPGDTTFVPQDAEDRITGPDRTPYSAHRDTYETMRHEANQRFDRANKMIIVSIVNRLISAFEAYIVTTRNNRNVKQNGEFSQFKVEAKLMSYTTTNDTPYLNVTYKF